MRPPSIRQKTNLKIVLYPTILPYNAGKASFAVARYRHKNRDRRLLRRNVRMMIRNVHLLTVCRRSALLRVCRAAYGSGQDLRSEARPLGSAVPSAAEGAGRLGLFGREGLRRHHQVQGLSVAAARQGLRPLRHGARRHRRPHLHQSGLSAGPLPDHRRGRIAVPDHQRQGRIAGDRRLVPQVCRRRR